MCKSIKLLLLCIIISSYTSAYAGTETVLGLGVGLRPIRLPDMAKQRREAARLEQEEAGKQKSLNALAQLRQKLREKRKKRAATLTRADTAKLAAEVQLKEAKLGKTATLTRADATPLIAVKQLEEEAQLAKAKLRRTETKLANTEFIMAIAES